MSNSSSNPLKNSEISTADVRTQQHLFKTSQKRTKHEGLLISTIVAIYIDELDDPFFISLQSQLILGRNTSNQSMPALLDLNNFQAFERGVSRKHGVLQWQHNMLFFQDLGSSNGSFINDVRVTPQIPHRLVSGDVLELAKIQLQLFFVDRSNPQDLTSSVSGAKAVDPSIMSCSSPPAKPPAATSQSKAPAVPNNAMFLLNAVNARTQQADT